MLISVSPFDQNQKEKKGLSSRNWEEESKNQSNKIKIRKKLEKASARRTHLSDVRISSSRRESVIQNEESDPFRLIGDYAFSDSQNVYFGREDGLIATKQEYMLMKFTAMCVNKTSFKFVGY